MLSDIHDVDNADAAALLRLQDSLTAYARDNVALVTIFIRDPYAAHYVRDEKVPQTQH